MNDLKRLFGKAVDSAEKASITHGYLGRFLLDGSEQIEVPGQPDIVWVRVGTAETDTNVTRARNVGVPLIFGLPVRMKLIDGQYRIIDIDHDRLDVGENPPVGITNSVWGLVDTPYDPGDNPGKILIVAGTNLVFDNANNHLHSLSELDDVSLAGSIVDGQALVWNDSTLLWVRGIPIHEIDDHSNVNIISPTDGQILRYNVAGSEWVNDDEAAGGAHDHDSDYYLKTAFITTSAGAGDAGKPIVLDAGGHVDASMLNDADIDHTLITNVGTNTHAQIDTHIADTTIHFTQASIDHTAITNIGTNSHAQIDTHIAATAAHGATGAVAGTTNTQTLTNKTLTTPTIGDFTNAQHNHSNAAGGGTVAHSVLTGLTSGDPHTQYALLAGRSGGQTLNGDTASGGNLKLQSTAHATKGSIRLLNSVTIGADIAPSSGVQAEIQGVAGGTLALSRSGEITAGNHIGKLDFYSYDASDAGDYAGIVAGIRVLAETTFGGGAGNANTNMLFFTNPGTTPVNPTEKMRITSGGNVGIGVTSPQGRIHGHDGTGGFLHVSKTAIDGTAQTIIPNGTGDVVRGLRYTVVIRLSSGITTHGSGFIENGGDADIYNNGTSTEVLKLRVNADGSVDVRRSAGTLTYTVSLWLVWL